MNEVSHRRTFEEFCSEHRSELVRLAHRQTGSRQDADDVVGAALAAAWENWGRIQGVRAPLAYVRRMVVNLSARSGGHSGPGTP